MRNRRLFATKKKVNRKKLLGMPKRKRMFGQPRPTTASLMKQAAE